MSRFLKTAAIAGFAAVIGLFSGASRAATVVVNGNSYQGWEISAAPGISLIVDSTSGSTLALEKTATFTNANEGLLITFLQTGSSAATQIDFNNESITNASGTNWSGFQFLLVGNGATFVQNGTSPFAPPAGYSGLNFGSNSILYGGSQGNMTTSFWGFGKDGDLIINANPQGIGSSFTFKEIPVVGPLVPLPAAAWQGLSALAGLGLLAGGKSLKKLMA